ncbi:MAG TPA: hypothetical protein DCX25_00240 [Candidatus Pacebacteria bacterium]|nr:MAG: hypothetical protein UX00_C0003G0034 [Microgenomates group bacterium GW2011_GWB1_45_17]KKU24160.1 MAG: hypothetical protein UX36_C0002G0143 [Microgenomates group bacterium GW2011_GWC1_46_15]KKU24875.1 MAG: hypothetical protein UX35_C0001G0057 [Microgenomates group bacterium GW2011_GWA1_46_15]HAV14750.1 hypothetical protein [Candidatus Paceibacterota bacterium]HCR11456.1 hypothetical protein [Candidatus Paceibacterota bacterium]
MVKWMRIFISREPLALLRAILDVTLDDLTDEEKQRLRNGEVVNIPADELLARVYGSTSFK